MSTLRSEAVDVRARKVFWPLCLCPHAMNRNMKWHACNSCSASSLIVRDGEYVFFTGMHLLLSTSSESWVGQGFRYYRLLNTSCAALEVRFVPPKISGELRRDIASQAHPCDGEIAMRVPRQLVMYPSVRGQNNVVFSPVCFRTPLLSDRAELRSKFCQGIRFRSSFCRN